MPKLLNINELCELLKVTRRTIYNMLQDGRLPQPTRRWGSPRWDEDEIIQNSKIKTANTLTSHPSD